jgi:hypothetical protein
LQINWFSHLEVAIACKVHSLRSRITNPKIDGLQVKEHSVIQKLKELHRKWQETCQNVHAHLHAPVSSILKTEPSPLSKRLGNGTMADSKTRSKLTTLF